MQILQKPLAEFQKEFHIFHTKLQATRIPNLYTLPALAAEFVRVFKRKCNKYNVIQTFLDAEIWLLIFAGYPTRKKTAKRT